MHQVFEKARENMVEGQILPNRVTDERLIAALKEIPRERFVPRHLQNVAYVDEDIDMGNGRWLPEPMVLARLVQAAEVSESDVVLDIGCGTGYSAAVLGALGATVVGLEKNDSMADEADKLLHALGIVNAVVIRANNLQEGYAGQAPYDVIVINGSVPDVPEAILQQLADGGRLVAVISETGDMGRAVRVRRQGKVFDREDLFDAAVPTLKGFEKPKGFVF